MKMQPPSIKILYLHEAAEMGGAEISLENLLKNMDRAAFDPLFVLSKRGRFSAALKRLGVRVEFLNMPPVRKVLGVAGTVRRLARLIREDDARIIHSNSIRTHLYGTMAGALTGIPVIWHQRNLIIDELIDPDRILSFLPDRIICNSRSVAKRFSRRGVVPPKVRVIYNGVDTGIFNPDITGAKVRDEFGIRPDELVVTIASRFDRRKGHDSFFKAADIISKRMPETAKRLRFLVVGGVVSGEDNPISSILKKTAEDLKMGDKILFTGFREDMPAIYAASDIVVLPSHAEACSRVVLEAMACARPVVAADEGGTPEMVADNDTGFLVPVERPEALAEKIIILARDRALAARMGEAGRERVKKNFSIEKNVKETEEIYRELAANRREN